MPFTRERIQSQLGIDFFSPTLLATLHPVTLEQGKLEEHIKALFEALALVKGEIIFTYPNADAGGTKIISAIESFKAGRPHVKAFKSLGRQMYFSLLPHIDVMVGNSSSGILESLAFHIPVVNVGNRQKGRFATGNIISVPDDKGAIYNAIQQALDPVFIANIKNMRNPYDRGDVAGNIVEVLKTIDLGPKILCKRFVVKL